MRLAKLWYNSGYLSETSSFFGRFSFCLQSAHLTAGDALEFSIARDDLMSVVTSCSETCHIEFVMIGRFLGFDKYIVKHHQKTAISALLGIAIEHPTFAPGGKLPI